MSRGYAKSAERNQAARDALEPLADGERPRAVTIGAFFAGLVALLALGSAIFALISSRKINGQDPTSGQISQLFIVTAVMVTMAVGMWKAKYWAVLGFQMLLALFLVAAVAGLLTASTLLQVVGTTGLIAVLGTLFYAMVKAMARIQMPERRTRQ